MFVADDFGDGDVFLTILEFTLFFIWIWLLIIVFSDIFRSRDLSGWGKALWTIFVILLPYIGVLVYLIARGHKMGEHARADEEARRAYIRTVAGSGGGGGGSADEIARLADLRDRGVITDAEFEQGKAKALSAT